jgi:DtxR family Mn-dependent transcriptional regulator
VSTPQLTAVAEDYIKVVWSLQEWSNEPVTTKDLAERLGVGTSTVSETVRRLVSQGLLDHPRYGAISLTEEGRRCALGMVRRHRLLETFLVNELGYTWDEVHDEAEVLEHAVSDLLVDRIDARLGHPTRDPHGDPIPARDLSLDSPDAYTLAVMEEGTTGTVSRISDEDPQVLRYFADLEFGLDAHVHIVKRNDAVGVIELEWSPVHQPQETRTLTLGMLAADAVWIVATNK